MSNKVFDDYYLTSAEEYLEKERGKFYKLDFDGDGENEIGIPIHSGAGGMYQSDGFCIFKKNKEGLWEEYAYGPDCTFLDYMYIIQFEGNIYFITNPSTDPGSGEGYKG